MVKQKVIEAWRSTLFFLPSVNRREGRQQRQVSLEHLLKEEQTPIPVFTVPYSQNS